MYYLCRDNYGLLVEMVTMPPCHGGGHGFKSRPGRHFLAASNSFQPHRACASFRSNLRFWCAALPLLNFLRPSHCLPLAAGSARRAEQVQHRFSRRSHAWLANDGVTEEVRHEQVDRGRVGAAAGLRGLQRCRAPDRPGADSRHAWGERSPVRTGPDRVSALCRSGSSGPTGCHRRRRRGGDWRRGGGSDR